MRFTHLQCSDIPGAEYKECSWCSSVYECHRARKGRTARKGPSRRWYSQKKRGAHAAMAQALYSGLCVNGGATLPLSSSDNSQGHLPIFDCTTLRMSLNSLDTVVDHLWPQQELDFPQEYIKPRVRSLLQEQIYGESPSDTRLALFCFAFSNMEVITLLAKLKKMDDSDYFEIQYRITQVARSSLVPPANFHHRDAPIVDELEPEQPLEPNALQSISQSQDNRP
ncbi:hypothetical protein FA13DRAFT_1279856 [Coprinellus micaceus]|uniref:Uncharacterized protein n=1 Tax=Coprinellus micaceus TaxID=71717 RepID=A0A4Y7ST83_COPMI|nr:hypothetical protein FA13DRAFT_1279856 [Coprinellus micaceus]